jgi:hypothetical protein
VNQLIYKLKKIFIFEQTCSSPDWSREQTVYATMK